MTPDPFGGKGRKFVELNGVRYCVFTHDGGAERGEGRNAFPVLVLVHGAGGSYLQWPPQIRRMRGLDIVAPDLPGHGESSGEACSDIQSYARRMGELLEVLGVSQYVVAGHSMGAAISLEIAHRAQSDVVGIGVLAAGERLLISDELMSTVYEHNGNEGGASSGTAAHTEAATKMGGRNEQWLLEADAEVLGRDLSASRAFDARPYASELDMPALIVAGGNDQIVPVSASRSLHDQMASSELHVLEDEGHMFMWERTDEVIRLMQGLMDRAKRYAECHQHSREDKVCG